MTRSAGHEASNAGWLDLHFESSWRRSAFPSINFAVFVDDLGHFLFKEHNER